MFYVVNKSKIYSYLIALCTVVILFVAATTINDMATPSGNLVETGTNVIGGNNVNSINENVVNYTQKMDMTNTVGNKTVNEMENKVNR